MLKANLVFRLHVFELDPQPGGVALGTCKLVGPPNHSHALNFAAFARKAETQIQQGPLRRRQVGFQKNTIGRNLPAERLPELLFEAIRKPQVRRSPC